MKIKLPDQYKHPLFYSGDINDIELNDDDLFSPLYAADILSLNNQHKPWEEMEKWIPLILEEWQTLSEEMKPLFEGNADQTYEPMIKGISLFFTLLYWTNEKHVSAVSWETDVKDFDVSIMNAFERIPFIMKRPAVYFSYIQLDEMFKELHKTAAKHDAIKKRKRG
ncbi:YpoC family protein [Jeotgalibacillus salarius]|uniref:YpoC-like domain-containing protein n=1 Tax=Jeotgalibacillus salarius TaxID=546023 RepID=A0A4Y8LM51_9BACL|nr:hypothetical protein [Jeotgalibacillus salarius]TFE03053.1 hypothetical protein E2626_04370 [Jeotgalibacillus salarius]